MLKNAFESFKGNLKWKVFTRNDISNYILMPEVFYINKNDNVANDKKYYLTIFPENEYCELIDKAIADIPGLVEALHKCFDDYS